MADDGLRRRLVRVEDGVYWFRQSWINTFLTCPEQARQEMLGLIPHDDTDATATGTAFHTGIETYMGGASWQASVDAAVLELQRLVALPGFRYAKVKTYSTMERHLLSGLDAWMRDIYPALGATVGIEHKFSVKLSPRVGLTGMIDFVDYGVWDWKTSSSDDKYGKDSWKLKRFAVQPTVYTYAAVQDGLLELDERGLVDFTFAAFTKGKTNGRMQTVECPRGPQDWAWLEQQLESIIDLYESTARGAVGWPLNDQHALCSELWCPIWASCKGRHYSI